MYKYKKSINGSQRGSRGFSLIELIVTIAIIGILVMLASPRFLGRTKEATLAKHLYNVKTLEDTMDRYVLENDRFPRLSEEAYTSEEVKEYANRIRDLTGEEITLDPEGKYYDIDYVTLKDYVKVPDKRDMPNYILQNPVGKVFFLEELTEVANDRADFTVSNPVAGSKSEIIKGMPQKEIDEWVSKGYIPVSTAEELQNIKNNLSGKYIQINDIDLSSIENFNPLGYYNNNSDFEYFTGVYDGGSFIINNLKIDKPNQDDIGLFGRTIGATLRNIGLENIDIIGKTNVGGLVGFVYPNCTIENSYSTGSIMGNSKVGGLVGVSSSAIKYSYSFVNVRKVGSSLQNEDYLGGLVGYNNALIIGSYSTGDVTGIGNQIGGLVGRNNSVIEKSHSTGTTTGRIHIGGLIGYTDNGKVNNSYSEGATKGEMNLGGLVGYVTSTTITNSYSTGKVEGISRVGGLAGNRNKSNSKIVNSFYDKNTSGMSDLSNGTGLTTEEMKKQQTYIGWDFNGVWEITNEQYPRLQNSKLIK